MNTLTSRKNTFATGWNEASGVCRKAPQPCMFNYAVRPSEVRCARLSADTGLLVRWSLLRFDGLVGCDVTVSRLLTSFSRRVGLNAGEGVW